MLSPGFCAPVLLGGTCRKNKAIGKIRLGASLASAIKESGEKLLEAVIDETDFEWLVIDVCHAKAHQHACGAVGENDAIVIERCRGLQYQTIPT